MCTVTYIPNTEAQSFVLTSNRDEKKARATIKPTVYAVNNVKVAFPKDKEAGGSWIAINENGRVCCLLNGGFVTHSKKTHHTKSRGLFLKNAISFKGEITDFFNQENLNNTEPFTLVTLEKSKDKIEILLEFVWDGANKHLKKLNTNVSFIWSSATLYSQENKAMRKEWFSDFMDTNEHKPNNDQILSFHSGKHTNNEKVNLVMERESGIKTVSITQITYQQGLQMKYVDLLTKEINYTKI